MKLIFRSFATLVIIYSALLLTACPAASLQKAQDASARIAKYANAGVNLTRDLYESHIITIDQKDVIAKKFVLLAQGGIAFDTAVANAKQVYGANAPANEVQRIFAVFDTQVVGQFLDLLQSLKLITNKDKYAEIIDAIRAAVIIVGQVFGQADAIGHRIEAVI